MKFKKIRTTRYILRIFLIGLFALFIGTICFFALGPGFISFLISCPFGAIQIILSSWRFLIPLIISSLFLLVVTFIFGPVFCSWICPMGLVNEIVHNFKVKILRKKNGDRKIDHEGTGCGLHKGTNSKNPQKSRFLRNLKIPREIKYIFLASTIIGSIVLKYPVFCLICPVGIFYRNILSLSSFHVFTFEMSIIGVIVLFEFFLTDRSWCGSVCPLGAFYNIAGRLKLVSFRVNKKKVKGSAPCKVACPSNVNIQGYIALIRAKKYNEALELVREENPLPSVCGMICYHPCEAECERGKVDESVAISALKRFIADHWLKERLEKPKPIPKIHDEKVAIIGSGPAGLAAAYDLVKKGYPVTVFESLPEPGGMLRVGIPEYRLPRAVLDADIQYIRDLGVEIKTNTHIGIDLKIDDLTRNGYKAIFIATGAHKNRKLNIEGEELEGILYALDFLKEVNLGKRVEVGKKVAVIGGGNVAIDAARTALRLGSEEVHLLYRRSKKEMPAYSEEVEQAESDGVKFQFLVSPIKFLGKDGRIQALECIRMKLGEPWFEGGDARRKPEPINGSEFVQEFDMILIAVGANPDLSNLPEEIKISQWGTITVDPITFQTMAQPDARKYLPQVFAGGDVVSGPGNFVDAVAAGKKAAVSIDRYLTGEPLKKGRGEEIMKVEARSREGVKKMARQPMPTLAPNQSIHNFKQVELGYTEELALKEAERCFMCGDCATCLGCDSISEELCPQGEDPHEWANEVGGNCSNCGLCKEICICEKASPTFVHPRSWKKSLARIFKLK